MAIVTKSIGSDVSRDYATITLWEADLDDGVIYSSGDDAVGECYNDGPFDESVTINGGGTVGLNSVTLSAASGERHDGTAGTGARIVRSTDVSTLLSISSSVETTFEWVELDANEQDRGGDDLRPGAEDSPGRAGIGCTPKSG